jgi:hypothetical protein
VSFDAPARRTALNYRALAALSIANGRNARARCEGGLAALPRCRRICRWPWEWRVRPLRPSALRLRVGGRAAHKGNSRRVPPRRAGNRMGNPLSGRSHFQPRPSRSRGCAMDCRIFEGRTPEGVCQKQARVTAAPPSQLTSRGAQGDIRRQAHRCAPTVRNRPSCRPMLG